MEEESKKQIAKLCFVIMILCVAVAVIGAIVLFAFIIMRKIVLEDLLKQYGMVVLMVLLGLFVIFAITGGLSHIFVDKDGDKWEKVAYFMTFPSYIISFIVMYIIQGIINYGKNSTGSENNSSTVSGGDEKYIFYNGSKIKVHFLGRYNYYGKADNPYFGKSYLCYQEDSGGGAGAIWISFDEGQSFVRETEFDPYTYK